MRYRRYCIGLSKLSIIPQLVNPMNKPRDRYRTLSQIITDIFSLVRWLRDNRTPAGREGGVCRGQHSSASEAIPEVTHLMGAAFDSATKSLHDTAQSAVARCLDS